MVVVRRTPVLGLVAAAALICACGLPDGDYFGKIPDPDPQHLRFCNAGEPEYLDPAMAASTTDLKVIYAMFDGLAEYGLQGHPTPSLATSWDISPDQRTFTFHLRSDARWSDGHPVTAHDVAYQIERVLNPTTGSPNAETAWKLKNGALFTAGRVKLLLRDAGGFHRGDIVEIVGLDGRTAKDLGNISMPDSNARTSSKTLHLRDQGAQVDRAYASIPPGQTVTIIEESADRSWAYVFYAEGDGVYGWVPSAELDGQPNGAIKYTVRAIPPEHQPGVTLPPAPTDAPRPTSVVTGRDLLMLPEVLGVRVPDDHTLVLETWGPLPYLIDQTPDRVYRPTPRWVISRWPKQWTLPEHVVTSGAYHLVKWHIRDKMELVKSKTFWDRAHVAIDKLTVFSLDEQTANANLYIQATCDAVAANNIPAAYLPFLTREHENGHRQYKDFHLAPALGVYFYIVNTKKFPNVHFRRALSYAVDRTPIPRITAGGDFPSAQYTPGTPIKDLSPAERALCGVTEDTPGQASIIEPGKLCYVPPPGLDYDLDKAHAELAQARKEMGPAFPRHFTIKFNSGVEGHKLIAEYLQQEWSKNLGLDVDLESQEWKTFLKDTRNGQFDVARFGGIGNFPDPEEFLADYKCKSPSNRPGWCNEKYDALFKKAEGTANRKERLGLIHDAEKELIEQEPVIPLYVYRWKILQKPYVHNLAMNPEDQVPFRFASIDPDWKQHQGKVTAGGGGQEAAR